MTKGQAILVELLKPFGARKAIAERVGADPTLVTRWGQGRQKPTTLYRTRFEEHYGVPLLSWDEPADEPAEASAQPPSAA